MTFSRLDKRCLPVDTDGLTKICGSKQWRGRDNLVATQQKHWHSCSRVKICNYRLQIQAGNFSHDVGDLLCDVAQGRDRLLKLLRDTGGRHLVHRLGLGLERVRKHGLFPKFVQFSAKRDNVDKGINIETVRNGLMVGVGIEDFSLGSISDSWSSGSSAASPSGVG